MEAVAVRCEEEASEMTSVTQSLKRLSESTAVGKLQFLELNEYCKYTKTNLNVLKAKIQCLKSAKKNAIKTRDELLIRQKINVINSESLFQSQSEFYNYKCELKTDYIKTEEAAKSKRLKYKTIISSYKAKWEAVEREYKNLPMSLEISAIEEDNSALFSESTKISDLFRKTEQDYSQMIHNLQNYLKNKTVEFVKECQNYWKFIDLNRQIREISTEVEKQQKELKLQLGQKELATKVKVFKPSILDLNIQGEANQNTKPSFSVDLTAFDNLVLPLESLEIQNEDLFAFSKDILISPDNIRNSTSESETIYDNNYSLKSNPQNENCVVLKSDCSTENNNLNKDEEAKESVLGSGLNVQFGGNNAVSPETTQMVSQYWKPAQGLKPEYPGETSKGNASNVRKWKRREKITKGPDEQNSKKMKYATDVRAKTEETQMSDTRKNESSEKLTSGIESDIVDVESHDIDETQLTNDTPQIANDTPVANANKNEEFEHSNDAISDLLKKTENFEDVNNHKIEENKFHNFFTGSDSSKTKSRTSSSIFNLF